MKLNSIKISNLLSFQYHENIDECQEIKFNKDLNILIGANAAGKSNFLEIINKIFKSALIQSCQFNETVIKKNQINPDVNLNATLQKRNVAHNLSKNYLTDSNIKTIKIKLELEESDYQNLYFIQENAIEINSLISTYCSGISGFNNSITKEEINSKKILEYTFIEENNNKIFILKDDFNDETSRFIYQYFNYFEFLQNIISLANRFHDKNWVQLKIFSALIGSYRNYSNISDKYTIEPDESTKWQEVYNKILEESTRVATGVEPAIFELVKHRFTYALDEIDLKAQKGQILLSEKKSFLDILREHDETLKGIEKLLKTHLGLKLDIQRVEKSRDYQFSFLDVESGEKKEVIDLSSGQKGLLHFIFSIFGYDMKNGLMVIDEPELHLHPQVQTKYLSIIEEIRSKLGIQFIMATHSPVFINVNTIDSVYRFYIQNGFTKIEKPIITEPDTDLIHFLSYTNSSKIFFSNKVVLVEGDNDEYFLRYYIENYKRRKSTEISDIQILNINGSGNFKKWKDFLLKYKITSFVIGDFDVLIRTNLSANSSDWVNRYGNGQILRTNIQLIQQNNPSDYSQMIYEISTLYQNNIFLFSDGSFEDYLEPLIQHRPKFKDVINFCKNDFSTWITTNPNDPIVNELDYFLHVITQSQ